MIWAYPVLRLARKILFHMGRRVSDTYDAQELTRYIVEGDKKHWNSGAESGCSFTKDSLIRLYAKGISHPKVLDFGGGGGRCGYFRNSLAVGEWVVVETPSMAKEAKVQLTDTGITFTESIAEARDISEDFDILHISSSLQYTSKPTEVLAQLIEFKPSIIVLEKLVVTDKASPIKFYQYSFLRDNLPVPFGNPKLWTSATRYPLTAIPFDEFLAVVRASFKISLIEIDQIQSHLPLCLGLRQINVIAERI